MSRHSSVYFKDISVRRKFRRENRFWLKLSEFEARTDDGAVRCTFQPYEIVSLP
jgi:hypothetical protein